MLYKLATMCTILSCINPGFANAEKKSALTASKIFLPQNLLTSNRHPNIKLSDMFTPVAETDREITVKIPENSLPLVNADITYMIADMKFNGTGIRILEFGEGTRSRFEGYDALNKKGAMWGQFWNHLASFNLPIYYVAPEMLPAHAAEINYRTFSDLGGKHIFNMYQAMDIAKKYSPKKNRANKTHISDYTAIIVIRHLDASSPIIRAFKKRFPDFLILDSSSAPFLNNKYTTSLLFDAHEELKQLRPPSKLYTKKYSPDLAQSIDNDFADTNIVVIKPLTACKGYGIIMTLKKDLDAILYNILEKTDAIYASDDTSYSYWAYDTNDSFLIERYEKSTLVQLPNDETKSYDATMRMVFVLSYQDDTIHFKLLDGYWKLPLKAQEEDGTLTEKIKSKINPNRQSSVLVQKETTDAVCAILKKNMPAVYHRMLSAQRTN